MKLPYFKIFLSAVLSLGLLSQWVHAETEAVTKTDAAEEVHWDDLVPPGETPDALIDEYRRKYKIDELPDNDPILVELMDKLTIMQKNAPLNESLNGKLIKIPGFVLPLETDGKKSREFLLVPYFGACIHTPPPPANQIIFVKTDDKEGAEIRRLYDTVWVTGTLHTERFSSDIADAGYRIAASKVEPYTR